MRKWVELCAVALCAALGATLADAHAAGVRSPQQLAEIVIRLPYLAKELTDGYRVKESQVADTRGAALGVKALSGFDLQGPPGPYNTVFVFYNFFDDRALAENYDKQAHYDQTGLSAVIDRNIHVGGLPGANMSADLTESCSVASDTDLSLICTVLEPRIPAVVMVMLAPGPPASARRRNELPIDTALRLNGSDRLEGLMPPILHQLARATIGN